MKEIPISEFKAKCTAILKCVARTKKPVRVTRFGKPVVEIRPVSPSLDYEDRSWIGSLAGITKIKGDIVCPIIDLNDIEAHRD